MSDTIKIFVSSVQSEFAEERTLLKDYVEKNPLLRRFFSVFVFEADVPPTDQRTDEVYLDELRSSDVCLFLIGKRYGGQTEQGISPAECEYDEATDRGIQRLVFVLDGLTDREPKEQAFLEKISRSVTWHPFADTDALLNWVLAALDKVMEKRFLFRTLPFDKSPCRGAVEEDLNEDRIRWFVKKARKERNFALSEEAPSLDVLAHLNLIGSDGVLTNAAVLLFGKDPQKWHLTSEVKCVHWHGVQRVKPIRSYRVYRGTLFDMADLAVEFVMAKLDYSVGVRSHGPEVDRDYEIPGEVVSEAIINAIAHRDYLSTGSVQVELFADRLEIYNPGTINPALTPEKLTRRHGSFPNNPLIAEPLYLTRYIERLGSGLSDLIEQCRKVGLPDPEFRIDQFEFGIVIRRRTGGVTGGATGGVTGGATGGVRELLNVIRENPGRRVPELAMLTGLSRRTVERYLRERLFECVEFRGAPKNGGYYAR